ncbi:MAG: ACT domain-containing protein [Clostridia bacterium]|nr:ACT domain-containing protein [Clostridia bacterium]
MNEKRYILVDETVLPEVYSKVIFAKQLLTSGAATSSSQAAKLAGLSRSAFYKYKDSVFSYNNSTAERIVTICFTLRDKPGVLSQLLAELYRLGANILTVNQNIPIQNTALVSITARIDSLTVSVDEMLSILKGIENVKTIQQISGTGF